MASLQHVETGVRYPLVARTVIGRSHSCQLRLSTPQVSGIHAELAWDGERWLVHDLGSRNGTSVDGRRLTPERWEPLSEGTQVAFGSGERFVMVDASPPGLVALGSDGTARVATRGLLCLPDEDAPEITLAEHADGRWTLEDARGARVLEQQEHVRVGDIDWTIHPPGAVKHTTDEAESVMSVDNVAIEFLVSRDEEHVLVRVEHDNERIDLRPRAHDFFLLTLARARLVDRERVDLDEAEHGWSYRDDLARRLQVDRNLLNVWIHRARRQFADAGVLGVARLIEHRRGAGQLRLGVARLRVVRQ